jgi:hypothetical protein
MRWIRPLGQPSTPPRAPTDPPRRRTHERTGHGSYANHRPPASAWGRGRWASTAPGGGEHAHPHTCSALIAAHVPPGGPALDPDAWQRSRGSHPSPATVRHGVRKGAWEDESDGRREGHGNTGAGAGAGLRTSLCAFRGVPMQYLPLSVATDDAMPKTTRVTPLLMQRMCARLLSTYAGYT